MTRTRTPRFIQQRNLTAAEQYFALRSCSACTGSGQLERGKLRWDYTARPTPLSREYSLRLDFKQARTPVPKVWVRDPDLVELSEGARLPHVYEQKPARLCLYLPGTGEWSPSLLITETIVPWSILWLFYFEDWLSTGGWAGGGIHPGKKNER